MNETEMWTNEKVEQKGGVTGIERKEAGVGRGKRGSGKGQRNADALKKECEKRGIAQEETIEM